MNFSHFKPLLFRTLYKTCLTLLLVNATKAPSALSQTIAGEAIAPVYWSWAAVPPMGWNSYDAYNDAVTEEQVVTNAQYMKDHLLAHGWNYVVIDSRWYDPKPTRNDLALDRRAGALLPADAFGRMLPATNRFPSAMDGHGFKALADELHNMGLKFGFHLMRGIPRESVKAGTPIENSRFTAVDAGDPQNACVWCPDMYGVHNNEAGQAWYDAEYKLYASWGMDFVKVDDLSNPYQRDEIAMIRKALDKCGRPIVFSTSAGPTDLRQAAHVKVNANMWRISGDFWDNWRSLNALFNLIHQWRGVGGPGHFPDADMIPFGYVASQSGGRLHPSRFTQEEKTTLMSLWCLASSPLIRGGNLPQDDEATTALICNDEVIAIDQDPLAMPAERVDQDQANGGEIWVKNLKDGSKAIGLFNRGEADASVTLDWQKAGLSGKLKLRDLWQHKELGSFDQTFVTPIPKHGAVLIKVSP